MYRETMLVILFCGTLLSGCGESGSEIEYETVRPIKSVVLQDKNTKVDVRQFLGVIQPQNVSELSFESAGNISNIYVDTGDQIAEGQILASLDDETYRLNLRSAEAELKKSQAEYQKFKKDYLRKKELHDKGYIATSELDLVLTNRDSSHLTVRSAITHLAIVQRELTNTILKAPFNGIISKRLLNPHTEVMAGQALFEVDASGQLEIDLQIPESLIRHFYRGKPGVARISDRKDVSLPGAVAQVVTHAQEGNAFLVKFELEETPEWVYSGMSAKVSIDVAGDVSQEGFLLPAAAILPDPVEKQHYVFVFNPVTSLVKKTPVTVAGGQDQRAMVTSGLSAGDIVAVAGASFLVDGMKVRLAAGQN